MSGIGDYRIEGELGRGGMGVVHRAVGPQGPCALKLLRSGQLDPRFQEELALARRLSHPGIVALLDHGETPDGQAFLALELVEGEDLEARLARGPLEPVQAAQLALELAEALAHAHSRGVIHRDLKPSNVLLTQDGHAKLLDFGIAKRLDRLESLTQTGELLGTPAYMAPEQTQSDKRAVGSPADVYALGATFYAMLTGQPPFQAKSAIATLHALLHREPEPPSRRVPGLDPRLDAICLRCLAKDPADRFPHARAVAEALRETLAPRAARASRGGGISLTLLLMLLVSLSAAAWRRSLPTPPPASPTPSPTAPAPVSETPLLDAYDALQERVGRVAPDVLEQELASLAREATAVVERAPTADGCATLARCEAVAADLGHGSYDLALELARHARALAPLSAPVRVVEGDLLRAESPHRDLAAALRCFEEAQALDPRLPAAYTGAANALRELQRFEDALVTARRLIEVDPERARSWLVEALLLAEIHQRPRAIASAEHALALDPTLLRARLLLALLHGFEEHPELAEPYLAGIDPDTLSRPDTSRYLSATALNLLQRNRLDEAEAACKRAMQVTPRGALPPGLLAMVRLARYYVTGPLPPPPAAIEDLERLVARARQLDPGSLQALFVRAQLLLLQSQHTTALEVAANLHDLDPTWLPARALLAKARLANGDADAAYTMLLPIVGEWWPWPPLPQITMGLAQVELGRVAEAQALAAKLQAQGDHGLVRQLLALAYLGDGRPAEALAEARLAVQELPSAAGYSLLTDLLTGYELYDEASRALEAAEAMCPSHPRIQQQRANLEALRGGTR